MLKPAQLYADIVRDKLMETTYDLKYMFYHDGYTDVYKPADSTWNRHEFVSVDENNNVLGYISYSISRYTNTAYAFGAINFSDNKVVFGHDLCEAVEDIFCKYHMLKLEFYVVIGNPIERSYDRMVEEYGGYIVGIRKKSCRLIDGAYYDTKLYDILHDDFLSVRAEKEKARIYKKLEKKAPDSCYQEFGADLDGCFRQSTEGCKGCNALEAKR